jgi:hypothetical protein
VKQQIDLCSRSAFLPAIPCIDSTSLLAFCNLAPPVQMQAGQGSWSSAACRSQFECSCCAAPCCAAPALDTPSSPGSFALPRFPTCKRGDSQPLCTSHKNGAGVGRAGEWRACSSSLVCPAAWPCSDCLQAAATEPGFVRARSVEYQAFKLNQTSVAPACTVGCCRQGTVPTQAWIEKTASRHGRQCGPRWAASGGKR